jgi:hypothetical protein
LKTKLPWTLEESAEFIPITLIHPSIEVVAINDIAIKKHGAIW